jgi:hypothetical protein
MITTETYYGLIKSININSLPPALVKGHEYVDKASHHGSDWNAYHSSETVRKVIDLYFSKVEQYFPAPSPKQEKKVAVETGAKKRNTKKEAKEKQATSEKSKEAPLHDDGTPTEKVSDSVKFIKRYAALHGHTKTKEQILSFINSLQRAILERRIRKTDPHATEINQMQDQLLNCYKKMGKSIEIKIDAGTLEQFLAIGGEEFQMHSIALLKRYVGMHGKPGMKEKAKNLFKSIETALRKGSISKSDKYYQRVMDMRRRLDLFISGPDKVLNIEEAELSGLSGLGFIPTMVAAATGAVTAKLLDNMMTKKGLSGVISSESLASKQFQTIGLQNPWLALIGDPSPGFSILMYGAPKSGKSTLALQFAKYLAQNHGKTLYWTKEEGYGYTMQEKIKRLKAEHPYLFISEELPPNLTTYQFVIIDSITKAGMDHRDMSILKHNNPGISFIFIAQSTKGGHYRGTRDLEHEVDVIVKVENGEATSYGRFNQGGKMKVPFN